jgi:FlaA1/EpsC-like NDP-sugar epimerase
VVGFADDRRKCRGVIIHGVSHLGGSGKMEELIRQYDVSEVMIASDPGKEVVGRIFEACRKLEIPCRVIPPYIDVVHQRFGISQLKDIDIEDLLRRDTVKIDYGELSGMINGRRVLVTGAAGSIGRQLCLQLLEFSPSELICVDMGENALFYLQQEIRGAGNSLPCFFYCGSVTNRARMDSIFSRHRPEIIFHAAAHKHVPLMEGNVEEVIMNNIGGTKNVADMADRYDAKSFVFISTDKAVKPGNIMGWTKRVGELYTQSLSGRSSTKFLSVRFGNVLNSQGSVVPIFRRQIERGGPVQVTHPDATRYFMTIPEAVLLILQSACLGGQGDLMILDMGEPVKITDLAELMVRMAGYTPGKEIEIGFTGLRPGEKLHEELVSDGEEMDKTSHPKINAVRNKALNGQSVAELVDDVLIECHRDADKAYAMMKEGVKRLTSTGELNRFLGLR